MKHSIILLITLITALQINNLELLDLYNNQNVKLQPVQNYGENTKWEKIFYQPDYKEITHYGLNYRIAVSPDGSVFMSNKYFPKVMKFDPNGSEINSFSIEDKGDCETCIPLVEGIFKEQFLFTNNGYDGIQFFDFEGKHVKTLEIDFMPVECAPLGNKIAIFGYEPWKNRQTRRLIILKDFYTQEETVLWTDIISNKRGELVVKLEDGSNMNLSVPGKYPIPKMTSSKDRELIVAFPKNGEVVVYSTEGEIKNEFKLDIEQGEIAQVDIDEYYNIGKRNIERFRESLKKTGIYSESQIEDMVNQYAIQLANLKDQDIFPNHLPYFTRLLVDSQGNLLVFEYTDKKNTNKFSVYDYKNSGLKLCTSSFYSKDYMLNFSPHSFIFQGSFIYNVAKDKNSGTESNRIVKYYLAE